MGLKKISAILGLLCLFNGKSIAQTRYLDTTYFPDVQVDSVIEFGSSITDTGTTMTLYLDFYEPVGDTLMERPLIIWIHGGGYTDGTRQDAHMKLWCNEFAHRGYATASIDYRLGISGGSTGKIKAIYRSVQDAKAAIRFFRRYASTYRIDVNKIIVAGSSVGAFTAMHTAYWDTDELPATIDTLDLGNLEGTSGNAGFSSAAAAVVNFWGAIKDSTWIDPGEPMIVSAAGILDSVVYPGSHTWSSGEEHGSIVVDRVAASQSIPHTLRMFEGAKHTLSGTGGADQRARWDTATVMVAEFLYCNLIATCAVTIEEVPSRSELPPISVYPNPSSAAIIIRAPKELIGAYFAITDQLGRNSIPGKIIAETTPVSIDHLLPGIYFIRLENAPGTIRLIRD